MRNIFIIRNEVVDEVRNIFIIRNEVVDEVYEVLDLAQNNVGNMHSDIINANAALPWILSDLCWIDYEK